jgi:MFS superfamily sulfate permease-like transporter
MLYWVMSGICIFLLAMIPIWTARPDMPSYPFLVLLLLGAIVVAVPLLFRDKRPRRRKGDWAA